MNIFFFSDCGVLTAIHADFYCGLDAVLCTPSSSQKSLTATLLMVHCKTISSTLLVRFFTKLVAMDTYKYFKEQYSFAERKYVINLLAK